MIEASQLVQSPLDSSDHAGGSTVARSADHGAAAPQISHCLTAVGRFTSSDGNIGGSKFKDDTADQQINKKIETPRFRPGRTEQTSHWIC